MDNYEKAMLKITVEKLAKICKQNDLEFLIRITDKDWADIVNVHSFTGSSDGKTGFFQKLKEDFE